jgi:hypothetical protein
MILDHVDALEHALVGRGWPAMSPWWMATLRAFYASGRRQCVLRVGRRGGKSSTLSRVAVLEALYGEHVIPPGDVGVVAVVSVRREEANERLRTIRAILDVLQVQYRPIENGLELVGRPIAFRVYVASIAGVSGFTAICVIGDELAKWKDADSGSNPATEVLASLRPTLAGQANARIFLSSSPMGKQDAHARAVDEGDTGFQTVACAPTWIARPTLTEAMCRELEPDPDTFQREYGAVPFDGSTLSLFSEAQLLACTRQGPARLPREPGVEYFAAQDPANRGGNGWVLAIGCSREIVEGISAVQIVSVREWRARKGLALDSDAVLYEIAGELATYGITELWQDQWSYDALAAVAARHGIELRQEASTQTSKVQSFEALRRRVADRLIELPDEPMVRADLLGVRKWISKGGAFSIELERVGGRHSDAAPAIALVAAKAVDTSLAPAWASDAFADGAAAMLGMKAPKKLPDLILTTDVTGITTAVGSGAKFPRGFGARWSAGQPTEWSDGGVSPEFKSAVAKLRGTNF